MVVCVRVYELKRGRGCGWVCVCVCVCTLLLFVNTLLRLYTVSCGKQRCVSLFTHKALGSERTGGPVCVLCCLLAETGKHPPGQYGAFGSAAAFGVWMF